MKGAIIMAAKVNKQKVLEEVITMTDTKWIWVKTEQAFGNGFDEYISADGHYCKQVWFDGYEEIFEIS